MPPTEEPAFEIDDPAEIVTGLTARTVRLLKTADEFRATGRLVAIDLAKLHTTIFAFYELINKSFNPQWGFCPPPEVNCGVNVPQLLDRAKPEARRTVSRYHIRRCVFCCNTTHANFVRGNAFVIINGQLIYKPVGAVALDGDTYRPLGFHPDDAQSTRNTFAYQSLVIAESGCVLRELAITDNVLQDADPAVQLAISGPYLVHNKDNVAANIPVRKKDDGQTFGNELNYDPMTERSSFSVFGVDRHSGHLLVASMFAGAPGKKDDDTVFYSQGEGDGVTLFEMGELLKQAGASDAIVGGGAGDAQQFVHHNDILAGQPRDQPDRPQVDGLRGLGAVLAVFTNEN